MTSNRGASGDPQSSVVLIVGAEELLVDRAIAAVVTDARATALRVGGGQVEVRHFDVVDLSPGEFLEIVSPSLFGGSMVVVLRGAHDAGTDLQRELRLYLANPVVEVTLALVHKGGAKGKGLLEAARDAGVQRVDCTSVTTDGDRIGFVRGEFAAGHRKITAEACRMLVDAVGKDLRELAASCAQLLSDTEGVVDPAVVGRYFGGRIEATGFTVADAALAGRTGEALSLLRHAVSVGVDPVPVVAALASGLRIIGRVGSSSRSSRPVDLARDLGVAPWMIDKARRQLTGWTGDGVATAVIAVAEADAAVKGGGVDPVYAVEKAVVAIGKERGRT
jgi:DNA polymerase III subunit delta